MTLPTQTSRTVAGVINSVETLEGGDFLYVAPFPKVASLNLTRFSSSTSWVRLI
jgi:hypothetical protein